MNHILAFIVCVCVFADSLCAQVRAYFISGEQVGIALPVSVLPPSGFQTTAAWVYYRRGGITLYDSVGLTASGQEFVGTIPSSASTIAGLEFYFALSGTFSTGGPRRITEPAASPEVNPIRHRLRSFELTSAVTLQPVTYRMISAPAELENPSVQNVLVDDFGEYGAGDWRLFRWKRDSYVEYPVLPDTFAGGKAFWLASVQEKGFDVGAGFSTRTDSSFRITLDTGWNQIGNPFAFPVAWNDVVRQGNVQGLWFFNGTSYDTATVLIPWEGYFVRNNELVPVAISIPPRVPTASRATGGESPDGFVLTLSAEPAGVGIRGDRVVVGFLSAAIHGDDRFDFLKPPPPTAPVLDLSIVREGRKYIRDFKPADGDGQHWEVTVTSAYPQLPVTVNLSAVGNLTAGLQLFVLDEDDFNAVAVESNSFTLAPRPQLATRRLNVIIGTREYASRQSGGIPLTPVHYALDQNYPNPFNPRTTISYTLARKSEIALEVFDRLGRRVKTLARGEQTTGAHVVQWEGDDENGKPVASGAYFYRLRAGDFTTSKKLLLVR